MLLIKNVLNSKLIKKILKNNILFSEIIKYFYKLYYKFIILKKIKYFCVIIPKKLSLFYKINIFYEKY